MEREACFIRNSTTELNELKKQLLNIEISRQAFSENDEKTKFYTGIPNFVLLTHVFNLVAPHVKHTSTNVLSQFQEFLITLMKLKLNSPFQDLAFRFGISVSTVSRVFDKWIDAMSTRLQFLIMWPAREELRKTMPLAFKRNFGDKVAVIIDCFEIFIERPSSLIARAMTWSNLSPIVAEASTCIVCSMRDKRHRHDSNSCSYHVSYCSFLTAESKLKIMISFNNYNSKL